jgi:hypothetical protein
MGKRQCELEGCTKWAQTGGTPFCIAHGGGKRWQEESCTKSARPGTQHCSAHGGGRRCQTVDCTKSALGDTGHCRVHGGGRRCQEVGCIKGAEAGGTPHCIAHGGGKRCQHEGCTKCAQSDTGHCVLHGGANGASTRAASSLLEAGRLTSDELTVLYSNGPDDRSVKLALGYVTAATSGC